MSLVQSYQHHKIYPTTHDMAIRLHHEAPGDPTLLEWIKDRLDQIIDLDPSVIVAALGILILLIPSLILVLYFRARGNAQSNM